MVNVKVLDLEHNNITCLKGLSSLPSLKVLNLGFNRVSALGIKGKSPVSSLEKVNGPNSNTHLEMSGDGGPLVQKKSSPSTIFFPKLEVLSLHSNRITSLLPLQLARFPKLNTLMLQDNEIQRLSGKSNFNLL